MSASSPVVPLPMTSGEEECDAPRSPTVAAEYLFPPSRVRLSRVVKTVPQLLCPNAELIALSLEPTEAELARANLPRTSVGSSFPFLIVGDVRLWLHEGVHIALTPAGNVFVDDWSGPQTFLISFLESEEEGDNATALIQVMEAAGCTLDAESQDAAATDPTHYVANKITAASWYVARKVSSLGEFVASGIRGASGAATRKVKPRETPAQVPQGVKRGVRTARQVTDTTLEVAGTMAVSLLTSVGEKASNVENGVATNHPNAIKRMAGVTAATKALVGGVGTVALAVLGGSNSIGSAAVSGVSGLVGRRYGRDAAETTADGLVAVSAVGTLGSAVDGVSAVTTGAAEVAEEVVDE